MRERETLRAYSGSYRVIPFRDVLDLLAVGVIVHDADTRIVYSNHVAERMLGIAGQELLQRDTFEDRKSVV